MAKTSAEDHDPVDGGPIKNRSCTGKKCLFSHYHFKQIELGKQILKY